MSIFRWPKIEKFQKMENWGLGRAERAWQVSYGTISARGGNSGEPLVSFQLFRLVRIRGWLA
jgi:hypothetical protein